MLVYYPMNHLISLASKNLSDIVRDAIALKPTEQALIIYDTEAPLTQIVLAGYREAIPQGIFIDFNTVTPAEIMQSIDGCKAGDLVVLLQSTNFRLNEFRFRIELFTRNLKTIEHIHLKRIHEDQFECYLNGLAYDPTYYRPRGLGIKKVLDSAKEIRVTCVGGTQLLYSGEMESSKLNVGDYSAMKNVGGTYPIGEVFTEAKDLTTVNGEAMIFGYAGEDHIVRIVEPFKVVIQKGILTASDAPAEFQHILELIKADEEVYVREFGLGLNPAFGKYSVVNDITAFERQKGMHMSLGAKHAVYAKQGINRKKGRYHVDIFVDIETIVVDGNILYTEGDFVIPSIND